MEMDSGEMMESFARILTHALAVGVPTDGGFLND